MAFDLEHADRFVIDMPAGTGRTRLVQRLMRPTVEFDTIEHAKPEPVKPTTPTVELLTLHYAAGYLNVTTDQVLAFIADGSLDYINVGRGKKRRRYRFSKQDLDAFIEHRRQREAVPCRSTKSVASTNSISGSRVIGFSALRAAQLAKKQKPSKR
jgi:excisionase family DNA binding protein